MSREQMGKNAKHYCRLMATIKLSIASSLPSAISRFDLTRRGTALLAIFAIALALRVVIAIWLPSEVIWSDGNRYLRVADNLLSGHGFGSLTDNRQSVPTQPLLLAAVEILFGKNFLALRLFFSLLGASSCMLGYILARKLFKPSTALLAGLLLAIYPAYIYMSALFEYPQTFFIFSVALMFIFLYDFTATKSLSMLFLSGLALGLAILSVPTALLFLPVLVLVVFSWDLRSITRVAIVMLAVSLPVGGWATRNYLAYGELILVNKSSGLNFWTANNETYYLYGKGAVVPTCGEQNRATSFCAEYTAIWRRLSASNLTDTEFVNADEQADWNGGLDFVRKNPRKTVLLTIRKIGNFWTPDPDATTRGSAQGGSTRTWIARLSYVPMLCFGLIGVVLFAMNNWRRALPIVGFLMALSVPYYVFLPTTRYRLPLDFLLIIFAAHALERLAARDWIQMFYKKLKRRFEVGRSSGV